MPELILTIGQTPTIGTSVIQYPEVTTVIQSAQGPAGASGAPVPPFEFLSPQQSWTINHNLSRRPLVGVFSVGGAEMWAEVLHVSLNQVVVYFDDPTSGYVICS